jgi:hypothetical protein
VAVAIVGTKVNAGLANANGNRSNRYEVALCVRNSYATLKAGRKVFFASGNGCEVWLDLGQATGCNQGLG